MRRLIDEIVDSVKSPERPKSPVDSYLTEEEAFLRQNSQLHYKHDIVEKLRELYKMLVNPPTMDGDEDGEGGLDSPLSTVWNLNVTEFKREVLDLNDDDERKAAFLETINESVMQLSFPHFNPRLRKMYKACYHYVSSSVDGISGHSIYLRSLLGLPERETEDRLDDSTREAIVVSPTNLRRLSNQSSGGLSAGKKRISVDQTTSSGGKTAATAKSTPKAGKEEKKSGKAEPKKEAKGKEAAKKNERTASPTKKPAGTPPTKATTGASLSVLPNEGRITPSVQTEGTTTPSNTGVDVKQEKKYREKLTCQAYMEMERLIIGLTDVFEEIGLADHATITS